MEGGAYIAALLRLCHHPSEAVVRRALKLITTSVSKLSLQEQSETKVKCCALAALLALDLPDTRMAATSCPQSMYPHICQTCRPEHVCETSSL